MNRRRVSYFEASARVRVHGLVDENSFVELCPAELRKTSPHLASLDAPLAFDDGVVVGRATLAGSAILIAAQEGRFNGGSVGEVHGAKIRGLLELALLTKPVAVLLLVDSGGVRLQEANAGLIAISEIMRAVLKGQSAGIPVFALIGGSCGAFGGMGIVARLCNEIVMSEQGRLGLSGPEVIETVKGVEEFDSRDRALVWRITGGKIRRTLGEATRLVDDLIPAFRDAATRLLARYVELPPVTLDDLQQAQHRLTERTGRFAEVSDGQQIWQQIFSESAGIAGLTVSDFNRLLGDQP